MEKELVSIVVISYNAEKTITETLDSILHQTYKAIELVIADDCSKDKTKEIIEEWVNKHNNCFFGIKKVFHDCNCGVTANANSGVKAATGKWIKFIAADDTLIETCIEDNVNYIQNNKCNIVFSMMHYCLNEKIIIGTEKKLKKQLELFSGLSAQKQYHKLLYKNELPAPTAFFLKKIYDEVGGFDEEIRMMEDWPFWIKCTKAKNKIGFLDKYTVNYRVSENSVSHSLSFYKTQQKVKEKYCYPNIAWYHLGYYYHEKILSWKSQKQDGLMLGSRRCKEIELIYALLWPPRLIEILKSR